MMFAFARGAGACFCLLGAAGSIGAAPLEPGEVLDVREALTRTLARNPELVVHGFHVVAAEAWVEQAALRPNPELEVTFEDALGTDRFRRVRSAETTVTLGWLLERGVREHLIESARAAVAVEEAEVTLARLDAAAETARRFVACLAWQARRTAAREAVTLATETEGAVRSRVDAALSPAAELSRARAERARAELAAEGAEHELLSAYYLLSAQWGAVEPDFAAVDGVLAPPPVAPYDSLLSRLEASPELARLVTVRRLEEAELALAEARRRRSWRVQVGVRRFEASDDTALVAGLVVPLPLSDRNQGAIAAARAGLGRTGAEAAAVRTRLATTLFVLHQELAHHVHVGERLGRDVIPSIAQALVDTQSAYERGRYGYLEWRAAQAELLAARTELLEANAEAQLTIIEIERLTGVPWTLTDGSEP